MNKETKEIYDTLQDIFKNVWEQQKYSELKNGVLLTLNIALFAVLARVSFTVKETIINDCISKAIFYILLLIFILHIFYIIQSFFPKDSNKENIKWPADKINIFFFGDIQKLESDSFLAIVIKKLNIENIKESENSILLNLSNQIIVLSEITQSKYSSFKCSISRMYILSTLFLAYFSALFFNFFE